ncbi:hypothetical protein PR202_gb29526 [Eleusine coracana subsp. coracana]|uniref:Uncharacterized protein n=1 Tax=Eleusine coracana subsp. coracana TaxID=191504 RepID=A0AAV5FZ97_ELECO|nr:hypothetical protein PR202_gb29526 [Eleusine coracana subsp. coracana]
MGRKRERWRDDLRRWFGRGGAEAMGQARASGALVNDGLGSGKKQEPEKPGKKRRGGRSLIAQPGAAASGQRGCQAAAWCPARSARRRVAQRGGE